MKYILMIICCILAGTLVSQDRLAEFYWLGYSDENEELTAFYYDFKSNPSPLYISIEEKDHLKMQHLSKVTKVKFKRFRYQKDCSNCHNWFISKKVKKNWKIIRYYRFEETRFDSIDQLIWYKPIFKSEFILKATKEEKISYLKGLYLKSGHLDSSTVSIFIDESPIKAEATKKLIESLGLKHVHLTSHEQFLDRGIVLSVRTTISFTANNELLDSLYREIEINNSIIQQE